MKVQTFINICVVLLMLWAMVVMTILWGVASGQIDPNSQDMVSNLVRATLKTILRV